MSGGTITTPTLRVGDVFGRGYLLQNSGTINVANDLKSNRIPILEFGWQVFYKMKRGGSGTTGGGSRQTPTLPVLTNMASDARF